MKFEKETINHVLLWRMRRAADAPAYSSEDAAGRFVSVSQGEARENTFAWAAALLRRGFEVGTAVGILAAVRAEWVECDLGNLLARMVTIGLYPTSTPGQLQYILAHSEARVLLVGGQDDLDRCAGVLAQCPSLALIVGMDAVVAPAGCAIPVVALATIRAEGRAAISEDDAWLRTHAEAAEPDDMITLVYTSGTTGPPKGAVLTHRNLFHVTDAVAGMFAFREDQVGLVYLPLAHILQRYAVYQGLRFGGTAYYTSRLTELGEVLPTARPHVLAAVPRVLEKIHARACAQASTLSPFKQRVFGWAFAMAGPLRHRVRRGEPLGPWDRLRLRIADRLVFSKIRRKLGDRVEFIISGGAPLAPELSEWFHAAGLLVIEGYGLTETSAPATTNTPDAFRFGTVGRAIPGTELRIAEDGEILVRGPGVFSGYARDAQATAEAFTEDGFFRTGDIGELDDGWLRITDRKKDLIITAAGKNVAPANIENLLKQHRLIGQAMVHGDRRSYLTCLITLCPDEAPLWAAEQGLLERDISAIAGRADVQAEVAAWVQSVNDKLARYESIKRWELLPVAFEVDNGYLTPTLKLKRREITRDFLDHLDALYSDGA